MKKKLLIAALLITTASISAQMQYGVRAGMNISNITDMSGSTKTGIHAGIIAQYMLDEKMGFETGLYYTQLGNKYNVVIDNVTQNAHYLQVPLTFLYKFAINKDLYFYPSAGFYLGFGVDGQIVHTVGVDIKSNFFSTENYKTFDVGSSLGLNLQYTKYVFSLVYDYGFAKINQYGDISAHNTNLMISVAYFF